jgi:hypothetical protein
MGKLNQDFRHSRLFDFIALALFILFLSFFAKSIVSIMGAFETETYTNTMAQITSSIKAP